jgi:hypothetical protein
MKAIRLPALLAELKPEARPERCATVGEFITTARALCKVRPRTLAQYETSLRRIVAGVCKLDGDESRFDYRTGGADRWREKIDAVSLDKLTPANRAAQERRRAYHAKRPSHRNGKGNPMKAFAIGVAKGTVPKELPNLTPTTGAKKPASESAQTELLSDDDIPF